MYMKSRRVEITIDKRPNKNNNKTNKKPNYERYDPYEEAIACF